MLLIASFCIGLWYSFSPGAVHAKESQVELGPYEAIVSKDPFDPERGRNENLTENDTSAEGDLKSSYQVYGTIIAGEMRQAFLMLAAPESRSGQQKKIVKGPQKNLRTVTVGDLVDGWRVADITAQGVKFESDGEYVEIGIFDEVKKERKATAPVALQTPRPKPRVIRAPQSTPAKGASSGKPGSRSQKMTGNRTSQYSKKRPAKKPQEIIGETEGNKQIQVTTPSASSKNPFLRLIRKAKEK